MTGRDRRSGADTRARIQRVARQLFTEKGYEATSTRDLTEALGLTRSSLYYHFRNKEEILASLVEERRRDLDELIAWVREQPPGPDLARRTALRWLAGTTPEHLATMRLAHANQPVMRRITGHGTDVVGGFDELIDLLAGEHADPQGRILLRMTFDTVRAALLAAPAGVDPADVLAAARRASLALGAAVADPPPDADQSR
ncbi:hypothetical protein Athai_56190 [Actinocatenispora thailandica]|uniref:HTH tetR-type domain-containing protein n=1 Tax=Actinocatenispora thailandica TaxID=227318 RepID=A0A7R7DUR0_9ACTN|nr:TetR/AcrR family transcriptional regulator [Actinocatenispora thailandica]BCJ38116.1 hypothetical protein Athai_56190 [Actinocatenispora thailandica]